MTEDQHIIKEGHLIHVSGPLVRENKGVFVVPEEVSVISTNAFHKCFGLKKLVINHPVVIEYAAVYNNSSLKEVDITSDRVIIKSLAFMECRNLRDVYISKPSGSYGVTMKENPFCLCSEGMKIHRMDENWQETYYSVYPSKKILYPEPKTPSKPAAKKETTKVNPNGEGK